MITSVKETLQKCGLADLLPDSPGLPMISCLTLNKLLNHAVPHLWNGLIPQRVRQRSSKHSG